MHTLLISRLLKGLYVILNSILQFRITLINLRENLYYSLRMWWNRKNLRQKFKLLWPGKHDHIEMPQVYCALYKEGDCAYFCGKGGPLAYPVLAKKLKNPPAHFWEKARDSSYF